MTDTASREGRLPGFHEEAEAPRALSEGPGGSAGVAALLRSKSGVSYSAGAQQALEEVAAELMGSLVEDAARAARRQGLETVDRKHVKHAEGSIGIPKRSRFVDGAGWGLLGTALGAAISMIFPVSPLIAVAGTSAAAAAGAVMVLVDFRRT